MMMTRDPRMRALVQKYFSPTDYFDVRRRMVGTGMVGGKSCGMLLSRKIVEKNLPELVGLLEPHDSFYVGTDVFYTFIVENDLWPLRIAQRGDGYLRVADSLAQGIENGTFPPEIEQGFRRVLDYFGQVPIIVRSSRTRLGTPSPASTTRCSCPTWVTPRSGFASSSAPSSACTRRP